MPRKYAVLKQFTIDLDRLLREAEAGFHTLRTEANPTQAQILAVYRPVHSLKGICGMVEETKLLVRAFHALEDSLPPLLPVRAVKARGNDEKKPNWSQVAAAAFTMAREVEKILLTKLDLWKKLGADDNESRGLVFAFTDSGETVRTWVAITALVGLVDVAEAAEGISVGAGKNAHEALLIESQSGPVAVFFDEIETTCTRLEAVQAGVPLSFKEWWAAVTKRRTSTAA